MTVSRSSRAVLIARAKSLALPVANCVAASLPPAHLLEPLSVLELRALVIVLAEAADPAALRVVTQVRDDGCGPALGRRHMVLRAGHRERERLRRECLPVPGEIADLEREYQREQRRLRYGRPGLSALRPDGRLVVSQ